MRNIFFVKHFNLALFALQQKQRLAKAKKQLKTKYNER
jgi:hypothetical protein